MADRIIVICCLLLSAIYLYATSQIPSIEMMDPLGPKAFPVLLGIGMLVVASLLILEMRRGADIPVSKVPPQNLRHWLVISSVIGWIALYFAALQPLGYMIDTSVFLLGMMAYFNRGKWMANILTALLFSIGSFFLFTKFLGVTLTKGFWGI
jgi:putative tricarboxylic transport membrane protein